MSYLDREFPLLLDDDLTRMAVATISIGAVLLRLADWTTVGWILVVCGTATLWLAHHDAIAPYADEPSGHLERLLP
jgi:hypothetical protein